MKKFSFAALLLGLCSSALSGERPELTVVSLCGSCGTVGGVAVVERRRCSLELAAARVAAADISSCHGHNTTVKLNAIANPSDGATELDAVLEAVHPVLFNSTPRDIAVVYSGCSEQLVLLANVLSSGVYQIPLLSTSFPHSPSHLSETRYHTHMLPNEAHLSPATVGAVSLFGWERVAILTEDTPTFTELSRSLQSGLESEGISVHHHLTLSHPSPLQNHHLQTDTHTLFGEDVKIFILNMSPDLARTVLCQALNTLRFPGYVWITHGWYPEGWWEPGEGEMNEGDPLVCTGDKLAAYLHGSLSISLFSKALEEDGGVLDEESVPPGSAYNQPQPHCLKSRLELTAELHALTTTDTPPPEEEAEDSHLHLPLLPASPYLVYDSVWTAATASLSAPLSQYPSVIDGIEFHGTSGPVAFHNGSRDVTDLTLLQYRLLDGYLRQVPVATLSPSANNSRYDVIYCEGEDPSIIWPDGIPLDGTPIKVEHFPYPSLMAIVYTYSVLGILFATACLVFNLTFREKKLIKLTSPNLNNIIVLGVVISYLSALTFFYPRGASTTGIAWGCNLRAWSVSLGFSVCYGTLNVKMWRVYAICRNPKPSMSKTLIKDYHLMLLVLAFVLVDTFILVVVMSLDNSRFTVTTIPNKQDTAPHIREDGIKEVSVVSRCLSSTEHYWISLLFGYKAIIQAIGLYLAFKIRKIKIRGLNDSREVSIILYVTSVIMLVILVNNFAFGDYIDVDGFVYGFGLSTAVTVVLCLTFIPKMVSLYRDPDGNNIFKDPASNQRAVSADSGGEIATLQKRVRELEKQVTLARSNENLLDINFRSPPPISPPPPSDVVSSTTSASVSSCHVKATSE